MRTVRPLAEAGFEVYFTNRWPQMDPATTWAQVAARHADALRDHFGTPVDVLGHSTGGSLVLQLIADRPDCVRRAVVASAAYRLGPVAKRSQLSLMRGLEETGHFTARAMAEGAEGMVRRPWLRSLLYPVLWAVAPRIRVERVSDAVTMLRAEDAFDVRDRLSAIRTETLVICGAQDYFWTPQMFAETAYRMPRGRLVMYPDAGHAVVTDRRFAGEVAAFLRG
jgi:pimeloyl-ACP methyl ester carboxylesterase